MEICVASPPAVLFCRRGAARAHARSLAHQMSKFFCAPNRPWPRAGTAQRTARAAAADKHDDDAAESVGRVVVVRTHRDALARSHHPSRTGTLTASPEPTTSAGTSCAQTCATRMANSSARIIFRVGSVDVAARRTMRWVFHSVGRGASYATPRQRRSALLARSAGARGAPIEPCRQTARHALAVRHGRRGAARRGGAPATSCARASRCAS